MDKGGCWFFAIIGIFVVAVAGYGVANSFKAETIDPSQESIRMVQPCTGWFGCTSRDERNAEHINLPNSEAQENNASANLKNAQATQVVSQTRDYQAQQSTGDMALGVLAGCVMAIALILLVGGGLVSIFKH